MATVTVDASKRPDSFHNILASEDCSGECVYKYDKASRHYILQSGSSCKGADCAACATTLPFAIRELVILVGKSVFPDPDNVSFSCGVSYEELLERLIALYVQLLKLQQRYRFMLGLSIVLGSLLLAGILAYFLSR